MFKYIAALGALALAVPAVAQDEAEATVDPKHIADVLEDAGYPSEFVAEESAYSQIKSKSGNYEFTVEFFDCNAGKECDTLLFYLAFRKTDRATEEALREYSGQLADGRTFLDRRGNPVVELELDLADGFSDTEFTDSLKAWDTMVADFGGFLAGSPAPAPAPAAPAAPAAASAPTEGAAPAATS